jgi:hypothetical protein
MSGEGFFSEHFTTCIPLAPGHQHNDRCEFLVLANERTRRARERPPRRLRSPQFRTRR